MTTTDGTFEQWLSQAQIGADRLTAEQRGLLQAAFAFRKRCGNDYYSQRLLSHFLLHCHSGLKVAQIARLVGISRPTASRQQGLSSREAVRQAHHRMDGRPYGKLLPRYAGPIAEFLFTHPAATRSELLDFIDHTLGIRVSRVALGKFLKKFGLDETSRQQMTAPRAGTVAADPSATVTADPSGTAGAHAGAPLFFARTQYAGAFLLMGEALDWLAIARQCLNDDYGQLQRGLLTSVFALVVGLERVWHLDQMEDLGFAPAGMPSAAGVATCIGTKWMPFAVAPARGTCSTATSSWPATTSTPFPAGHTSSISKRAT